ncbi:glycosyltransferase family 4 protein [Chryseobacterium sp. PMSZPI]|uniref:glycosyltransferase family 4 protein n=1 Tax=Chryseobacterium sp. PMSZPI TaxID=1033900 RepID=UPI000C3393EA|nr:glycosyltransferase family 4 protein [Chryseobacterium sp. PMSZPI]PKF74306.1 glycosyltransferase family 4 protein [Chryseobacterium sp. PMSZPI]
MKIVYCIPSLDNSGGTERILTDKVNYLAKAGDYDITIITTEGESKKPYFLLEKNIKVVELNINFNEVFNYSIVKKYLITHQKLNLYTSLLQQFLDEQNVDICVSTGGKEMEFFKKIKSKCVKVCELHFSKNFRKQFLISRKNNIFWRLIGNYRNIRLIQQVKDLDQLVVLTRKDLKEWKKDINNVTQIYNFSPIYSNERSLLNNHSIIAAGRLDPQKGFDMLIKAWSLIQDKIFDWKLNIYGQGDLYAQLSKDIDENKLNNTVFLKGRTNDIKKELLESSIFVLSSRYEGFPMVMLESLTCGIPIVSFNCETGPDEIIINDDCGILVENGNIEKLAEGILRLINDNELRVQKSIIAKKKSEDFSKEVIMQKWINLFNELYLKNKTK